MSECTWKPKARKRYANPTKATVAAVYDVDQWNQSIAIGAAVCLHKDDGSKILTKTTSVASVMCGSAVAWFEGVSGCYAIDRAHVVAEKASEASR